MKTPQPYKSLIIFCIGFCMLSFMSVQKISAQDYRYLIQTNQFGKAKTLMLHDLKNNRLPGSFIYQLGKIYLQEKNADSAVRAFEFLDQTDNEQKLLYTLGNYKATLNDNNQVEINLSLQKSIKQFSYSKSILVKLEVAELLATIGEVDQASQFIEEACNQTPVRAENFVSAGDVYVRLSYLLNNKELYGKACGRYEQALLVDNEYLPAHTALAKAYIHSRNFTEARIKLNTALSIDSTWIPALQLMGELQYDLGKYDQASKYYTEYISKINPGKLQLQKYSFILYFNKEYAKSREILAQLLKSDPDNRVLLRLMAYTSCELQDPDQGLQAMQKLHMVTEKSDTVKLLATDFGYYGRLLSQKGNDSLAIDKYLKAITIDSTDAGIYENMAKSYEKTKNYLMAYQSYGKAIENIETPPASLWFTKGRMAMLVSEQNANDSVIRSQMLQSAVSIFQKVADLSPSSHLGFLWKARAQASMDPESTSGLAEDSYNSALGIMEQKNQPSKYKSELVESYSYLAYLNYLRFESHLSTDKDKAETYKTLSLSYWDKILVIDENNQTALQAKRTIK